MPDGTQVNYLDIIKRRRATIEKLPDDQQDSLYGYVFDAVVAPRLKSQLGTDEAGLQKAQQTWITAQRGKPQPVGEAPDPSKFAGFFTKQVAELQAAGAGAAGTVKKAVDWARSKTSNDLPFPKALSDVLGYAESKYGNAAAITPTTAPIAAGFGHAVVKGAAFEAGANIVPHAIAGAPFAVRALSRLGRTGAGTLAMAPTEGGQTGGEVVKDIAKFTALDVALGTLGKGVVKGGGGLWSLLKNRGLTPNVANVKALSAEFMDTLKTLFPDKHAAIEGGAKVRDVLTPQESSSVLDALNKKEAIAQATAKQTAKADKIAAREAVKQQEAAQSGVEKLEKMKAQALEKEQLKAKKVQETKVAKESAQRLAKGLSDYRKATGEVPNVGSAEYVALDSGVSAADVLKHKQASAMTAATGVADAELHAKINEVSPQTQQAVEAVQALGGTSEPTLHPERVAELEKKLGVEGATKLSPSEAIDADKADLAKRSVQGEGIPKSEAPLAPTVASEPTAATKEPWHMSPAEREKEGWVGPVYRGTNASKTGKPANFFTTDLEYAKGYSSEGGYSGSHLKHEPEKLSYGPSSKVETYYVRNPVRSTETRGWGMGGEADVFEVKNPKDVRLFTQEAKPVAEAAKPVVEKAKPWTAFGVEFDPTKWEKPQDIAPAKKAADEQIMTVALERAHAIRKAVADGSMTKEQGGKASVELMASVKEARAAIKNEKIPAGWRKKVEGTRKAKAAPKVFTASEAIADTQGKTANAKEIAKATASSSGGIEDTEHNIEIGQLAKAFHAMGQDKIAANVVREWKKVHEGDYATLAKMLREAFAKLQKGHM